MPNLIGPIPVKESMSHVILVFPLIVGEDKARASSGNANDRFGPKAVQNWREMQ
jgi:hypothetical protein